MHFSRIAIAAFAALPSLVSAFTLGTISDPIGDVPQKCASQFNIPLMSCGLLPGRCSEACVEQLKNLSKTLKGVCSNVDDPQGLLFIALEGDLTKTLCTNGGSSSNSNSGDDSQPSPVASPTAPVSFQPGPGKTAEPTPANAELNFSGVVEATSAVPAADAAPTGLVTDTSIPDDAAQTGGAPTTYRPSTLQTSASPTSSSSSSGDNSNGSLFTSQEDEGNSAGALRAGLMGLAVGFLTVIVNIA